MKKYFKTGILLTIFILSNAFAGLSIQTSPLHTISFVPHKQIYFDSVYAVCDTCQPLAIWSNPLTNFMINFNLPSQIIPASLFYHYIDWDANQNKCDYYIGIPFTIDPSGNIQFDSTSITANAKQNECASKVVSLNKDTTSNAIKLTIN